MNNGVMKIGRHFQTQAAFSNKPSTHLTTSFKDVLVQEQNRPLKISKHAQQRLAERNIHIDTEQWMQIQKRVWEAKQKGINESLVLTNEAALIVSAKNNTVITAMNREEAKSQIFTNISGTILLD
ncbi:flagellar operon protein [Thermolongibacillus altinsuensis]|uniref:Flagellar operon protein n=1 Tax=Thermolongibacillus altinsuensis TaxID=575256 RepID=A0A4V6NGH3_9BACL|nr:TIGR02530 family flagellar biosynthesis protein [Thermolongibacillus altinsuensis]TCL50377.1 flagellar operon protein [Thermolongibacillus altinsuensis]